MSEENNVINFSQKRSENVEDKRRAFERILFQNFMGTYTVVDENGSVFPIGMVDVSYDGCMFQIPWNHKKAEEVFPVGEDVTLRFYFTEKSYLPLVVNVRHISEHVDATGTFKRFGCSFDKETQSYQAFKSFVDFIYRFAEHSVVDRGDHKVYFL